MVREEVLNNSRELVKKIYEKMGIIESCDAVAEKIKNLDVCFNDPENEKIVVLNEILNAEQLVGIREGIIENIYNNAKDAQNFLERLNRKPAIINPEFEQAVKEMEEQSIKKPVKEIVVQPTPDQVLEKEENPEKPVMTIKDVKRMYHHEDKTITQIAEYYGENKKKVANFIQRNNLSRTSYKKDDGFRDHEVEQRRKQDKPL